MIIKNRKEILLTILAGSLIFAFSLTLGIVLSSRLDNPDLCKSCHGMQPYYSSYLNPQNGSIILNHKLNCIQCHASRSIYYAKKEVATKIILYKFNLSGSFRQSDLKPNCQKCHSPPATSIHSNVNCTDCHWAHKPAQVLITNNTSLLPGIPSGPHRNQSCSKCHGTTFQIPRCINCHKGHGEQKLENRLCLACHTDPHVPRKPGILPNNTVNFTKDLSFSVCQPCHENEYFNLTNTPSGHKDMQTCSLCHDAHGKKPRCSNCHPGMMLNRHPSDFTCQTCHAFFEGGVRITCQDCHGRTHEWSGFTAVLNPK